MNYLIEPTNQKGVKTVQTQSMFVTTLILLTLLMGSAFIAGLTWNEFPYFTAFPALLGLACLRIGGNS